MKKVINKNELNDILAKGFIVRDCILENFDLADYSLGMAQFINVNFNNVTFTRISFLNSAFDQCKGTKLLFSDCQFVGCTFLNNDIQLLSFMECQHKASTYQNNRLSNIEIISNNHEGSSFLEQTLTGEITNTEFKQCGFSKSVFEQLKLLDCVFHYCGFNTCRINRTIIEGCTLQTINFQSNDWQRTTFPHTRLQNCIFDQGKIEMVDFNHILEIKNMDFHQSVLRELTFGRFIKGGLKLHKAELSNLKFLYCHAPTSIFYEAKLRSCTFENCDMKQSNFEYADIDDCTVQDSTFEHCQLNYSVIRNSRFSKTSLDYSKQHAMDTDNVDFKNVSMAYVMKTNEKQLEAEHWGDNL